MRKSSFASVGVCALLLVVMLAQSVSAYSVKLSYLHASNGVMDFERDGYCADTDPATHTFMPTTQGFNEQAKEVLNHNGGKLAPMGGYARQAICVDGRCNWQYYKGLYHFNQRSFFAGIYYKGVFKPGRDYTHDFPNFWAEGYPVSWDNLSAWGARQVALRSDGTWNNVNVVTYFTDWICEIYQYQKSDYVFFPTWVNGDPITGTLSGQSAYSHCGKKIGVDSQGRLVDVQCEKKFPWWAGLIIAVICLIVLVAIIIIIWCCCCLCDRRDEEEERNRKLATTGDNPSNIPNQSEIGMSRTSSARFSGDEEDDERSFSRRSSTV